MMKYGIRFDYEHTYHSMDNTFDSSYYVNRIWTYSDSNNKE